MTTADKPVYDIKDVEHGNKFMVRPAGGGAPQIVHNCSQSVSTAVFNDIHVRAHARIVDQFPTARFVTSVHDELLYASKEGDGASVLAIVLQEMEVPPVWWPELPIRGEGDFGFGLIETNDWFNKASRYGMLK